MFSENHIYTFYYIYKKGFHYYLPTIMKKIYTPFSFLLVLYKLCIIKIYLCTKDFFCFCFPFFFPSWDGGGGYVV